MTREEALKRVKGYLTDYFSADCYREVEEIMEALEQQSYEDTVSRQVVLDINEHHHGQMPNHVNHEIWNEIKALPPATPKQIGRRKNG